MREITSAGVLLFRDQPEKSFLLLRSGKRWDVPKGHVEKRDASEIAAALRELREETGIQAEQVTLDEGFRFTTELKFKAAYLGGQFVHKTYVVFLAYASDVVPVKLTEHTTYQWFAWNPPHRIQKWLIDPLLQAVAEHFVAQEKD